MIQSGRHSIRGNAWSVGWVGWVWLPHTLGRNHDQLDVLALEVLEGDVDVLDVVDLHPGRAVVLAEALATDELEQVDQANTILEVILDVLEREGSLAKMKVAPLGEGLSTRQQQ